MTELIHQKMVAIMKAVGPIAKGSKAHQGYEYRSAVDVFNRLHPIMAEHGVTMRSDVIKHEVGEREWVNNRGDDQLLIRAIATVKWSFVAEDGSSTSTTLAAEGCDYQGDKATNKVFTVTQRQAVCQAFMIPTADAVDPEDPKHDTAPPQQARGTGNALISNAQRKRLFAISKSAGLSNDQMKAMLKGYGYESSNDILKKDYEAICKEVEAEGNQ